MEAVFSYIISLGAAVMMPIIFTILGVCIGIKFSKALKSGLLVGVGFVGLSVVTALLTSSLGPALSQVVEIYGLQLKVFDMGWPAAAAVAYNTSVGAFIIPVCLGVNILMLLTKTTRTVNIDLWNYWHFAFIGAIVYFASDSILWGFFAAIICYIITLVMADYTADKFQGFYANMEGISIPQPFCQGFVPFAIVINKVLDKIPGFDKLNIDAEGMKKKFGLLGEPLFLGILVGCGIGILSCKDTTEMVDKIPNILGLGIKMGAVMELIPRITGLFIEGLKPISDATREMIAKKFKGAVGLNIGMSPALVIGHPATLVVSLLLIPVTLLLAVVLPGNEFLPLASLAGMFYVFPLILPITKGNVFQYPFQMKYLSFWGYQNNFFPEKLPDKVEDYEMEFMPSIMQGNGWTKVSFHTDSATIEQYIEELAVKGCKAESLAEHNGAALLEHHLHNRIKESIQECQMGGS